MKLLAFTVDGAPRTGRLRGDRVIGFAGNPPLSQVLAEGAPAEEGEWPLAEVAITAPLPQARLFCIGLNYPKPHPLGGEVKGPANISYFLKHQAALMAQGAALRPPGVSAQFDYECELAVVIGKGGHLIAEAEALAHIGGYTILNDGSVRDWQAHSVTAGKNFFESGSWGPYVTTADEVGDWRDLRLRTRLNGRTVQDSKAGAMFFGLEKIIAYLSTITPLVPGDVIATGSPEGTGATQTPPRFLVPGDSLEFEVSGLGILTNTVA